MLDRDIRACLRAHLEAAHAGEDDTLIVDELGVLQGAARVDLAVVNGSLCGWEIKSERDTLRRLPAQADAYSRVFDEVTLVVAPAHAAKATAVVPEWWGVATVTGDSDAPCLNTQRESRRNPGLDALALAELLWRDESLELLTALGLDRGLRSKPRRALWAALVDGVAVDDLAGHVRDALKCRPEWRAGHPQT